MARGPEVLDQSDHAYYLSYFINIYSTLKNTKSPLNMLKSLRLKIMFVVEVSLKVNS